MKVGSNAHKMDPNLWLINIVLDMALITTFINKRGPSWSQFRVLNSTVLPFKLEVRVNGQKQRVQISTIILYTMLVIENI